MLEPREAVQKAMQYVKDLIGQDNMPNLLLEELEYDEANNTWKIVVGYDSHLQTQRRSGNALTGGTVETEKKREYKLIEISGDTGEFKSIRIN